MAARTRYVYFASNTAVVASAMAMFRSAKRRACSSSERPSCSASVRAMRLNWKGACSVCQTRVLLLIRGAVGADGSAKPLCQVNVERIPLRFQRGWGVRSEVRGGPHRKGHPGGGPGIHRLRWARFRAAVMPPGSVPSTKGGPDARILSSRRAS